MGDIAKLVEAASGFAWPILLAFVVWYFRTQIAALFQLLRQQLASGVAVKWRDFEFKGFNIESFDSRSGSEYRQVAAEKSVVDERDRIYKRNKNLFLVHRVRPTGQDHSITGLPTFDVSVYLMPHKNYGYMNDVREVEYYFGRHFGLKQAEFGTKFIVRNGSDNFAVRVNAYGPMLCEAHLLFHDGSKAIVNRYLDFEGTIYSFQSRVNELDEEKIRRRQEG